MRHPSVTVNGPLRREDPADSAECGFFVKYAEHGSPFDIQLEDDEGEDVMAVNGVCHFYIFSSLRYFQC